MHSVWAVFFCLAFKLFLLPPAILPSPGGIVGVILWLGCGGGVVVVVMVVWWWLSEGVGGYW